MNGGSKLKLTLIVFAVCLMYVVCSNWPFTDGKPNESSTYKLLEKICDTLGVSPHK